VCHCSPTTLCTRRSSNCWSAENFFATLKVELVNDTAWATRATARTDLFDYLELFYNGQRRHWALGYLSPRAFESRRKHEAIVTRVSLQQPHRVSHRCRRSDKLVAKAGIRVNQLIL